MLRHPRWLANGSVEIPVVARVERNYRLQVTTNPVTANWINLRSFMQTNDTQNMPDSEATNFSSRFYRVVAP
jgi:hypothetical protein